SVAASARILGLHQLLTAIRTTRIKRGGTGLGTQIIDISVVVALALDNHRSVHGGVSLSAKFRADDVVIAWYSRRKPGIRYLARDGILFDADLRDVERVQHIAGRDIHHNRFTHR